MAILVFSQIACKQPEMEKIYIYIYICPTESLLKFIVLWYWWHFPCSVCRDGKTVWGPADWKNEGKYPNHEANLQCLVLASWWAATPRSSSSDQQLPFLELWRGTWSGNCILDSITRILKKITLTGDHTAYWSLQIRLMYYIFQSHFSQIGVNPGLAYLSPIVGRLAPT